MSEFVKAGSRILTRPTGIEYTLSAGTTYQLKWDDWNAVAYLELGNNLTLPENYYSSKADNAFVDRVLNYFNTTEKHTTGVMLKGLKGAGKSVCAKKIALDSNLPIIVVDPMFPARRLNEFFSKFEQPVCVLFDELEKNERCWKTDDLLTFLDGISATCKKLVVFTCNSDEECCDFIKDRCSRVRYSRTFNAMSEDAVFGLCNRELDDEGEARAACAFILNTFKTISFDNVLSFLEEVKLDEGSTYEELIEDLNIYKK
jgi:SpoVK/Ycf46/Vps4 family AAA+-type ATPase